MTKNVWQWIGLLECISNVDERFRLMGSLCDWTCVCSSICSLGPPCTCSQMTSELISRGRCLVIHNGEGCKCETGSHRDGLDWDRLSQGCLLRNSISLPFSLLLLVLYIDCPPQGQNKPQVQSLSSVKLMKCLWVCQRGRIKPSNRFLWDCQKYSLLLLSDPQN